MAGGEAVGGIVGCGGEGAEGGVVALVWGDQVKRVNRGSTIAAEIAAEIAAAASALRGRPKGSLLLHPIGRGLGRGCWVRALVQVRQVLNPGGALCGI